MTDAEGFLRAGKLSAAIGQVAEEVKANPSNYRGRTFLFELLCFAGDLDGAGEQLDAIGQQSTGSELAVRRYQSVLQAESARRRLFSEGLRPNVQPETPPYAELHFEALNCIREGQPERARVLLEEAEASRPALPGRLNGNCAFEDFKDCDDLIGPFLEAFIQADYNWIPWEAVSSVSIEPPKHSRDLIWIPARFELRAGDVGEAFLPVLYANSHLHSDERVRLGRATEWRPDIQELALGLGQRLFAVGDRDFPMLEVRQIEFEHANATSD